MCALKKTGNRVGIGGQDWWQWVESVWPVAIGIVAWEFETFEKCCLRRD